LLERYQQDQVKGEIVLVIGPPLKTSTTEEDDADLDRQLLEILETHSVKDAAREVASRLGRPRRDVYARALALGTVKD